MGVHGQIDVAFVQETQYFLLDDGDQVAVAADLFDFVGLHLGQLETNKYKMTR